MEHLANAGISGIKSESSGRKTGRFRSSSSVFRQTINVNENNGVSRFRRVEVGGEKRGVGGAKRTHNLKVIGSNPIPATNFPDRDRKEISPPFMAGFFVGGRLREIAELGWPHRD
jgi:hypothetical protein